METEGSLVTHYVGIKRLGAGSFGAAWLVADQSDKNAKFVGDTHGIALDSPFTHK